MTDRIPMRRSAMPEEVAAVVHFLSSRIALSSRLSAMTSAAVAPHTERPVGCVHDRAAENSNKNGFHPDTSAQDVLHGFDKQLTAWTSKVEDSRRLDWTVPVEEGER